LQTHELFKITVTYNIAAGAFYTIEYLYDSQGALLFYYWKEDVSSPPQEKRYYYTRGTLFRAVVDYESDNAQRMKYLKDKDFSTEDLQDAARMVKKAADYKRLFETLVTAEQWR
jgi:ubiquinone/menaquinone biosynthesis C-methylase UbiE